MNILCPIPDRRRDALLMPSIPCLYRRASVQWVAAGELLRKLSQPETGGRWSASMVKPEHLPVGASLRIIFDMSSQSSREDLVELPGKLITIQRHLSLNITRLSKVLLVERPTIYAWMAEESSPHVANLNRVNTLYSLATAWNRLHPEPLGQWLDESIGGCSVSQLLQSPQIERSAVIRRFRAIAEIRRRTQAARQPSVLDLMREHNFTPTPEWMAREAIDSLSHK